MPGTVLSTRSVHMYLIFTDPSQSPGESFYYWQEEGIMVAEWCAKLANGEGNKLSKEKH